MFPADFSVSKMDILSVPKCFHKIKMADMDYLNKLLVCCWQIFFNGM